MKGFLLDTNVPSELTRPRSDPRVERWLEEVDDEQLYLSVISFGELLKGLTILPESKRRIGLQKWLDHTLRPWFEGRVLPVDESIAERWGVLAGECHLRGAPLNTTDGLIAATALEHNLTVVTRNVKDFARLGVAIFNPWEEPR
jgi:predicted nucleic acid-binding protein